MASAYISEYATVGAPGPSGDIFQCPQEPALTEQLMTISGSSTQSAPFDSRTRMVRVEVDAICSLAFGLSPTAVTTAKRFAANQTEYFGVIGGHKVAVIANV